MKYYISLAQMSFIRNISLFLLLFFFISYSQFNFNGIVTDCDFYFDDYFEVSALKLEFGTPHLFFGFIMAQAHKTGEDAEMSWFSPIIRIQPFHFAHYFSKCDIKHSKLSLSLFGKFHNFVESRENLFNIGSQLCFRPIALASLSFKSGTLLSTKKKPKFYGALSFGIGYEKPHIYSGIKINPIRNRIFISCISKVYLPRTKIHNDNDSLFFYLKNILEDKYEIKIYNSESQTNFHSDDFIIYIEVGITPNTHTFTMLPSYGKADLYNSAHYGVILNIKNGYKKRCTSYEGGNFYLDINSPFERSMINPSPAYVIQESYHLARIKALQMIERLFKLKSPDIIGCN